MCGCGCVGVGVGVWVWVRVRACVCACSHHCKLARLLLTLLHAPLPLLASQPGPSLPSASSVLQGYANGACAHGHPSLFHLWLV